MKYYIFFVLLLIFFIFTAAPSYHPGSGGQVQPSSLATTSGASYFYHNGLSGASTLETPATANRTLLQADGGDIRWYALSGVTPTSDKGFILTDETYLELYSYQEANDFRWVPDKNSSGATVVVLHSRT